jgi:predicted phosphate transport protein (TIGR00153 family)
MLMAHFDRVQLCVENLREMFDLYLAGEFHKASELSHKISRYEHEADQIKVHMRHSLPRMIFMPVSRPEMLDLLTSNERIADKAQDVAQSLDLRQTKVPEALHADICAFVNFVVDAVRALKDMLDHLGKLMESSFARSEIQKILEIGQRVHEGEYKADAINKQLARRIYALENTESTMTLIHLMRVLRTLDSVADHAENSALRMVVIASK